MRHTYGVKLLSVIRSQSQETDIETMGSDAPGNALRLIYVARGLAMLPLSALSAHQHTLEHVNRSIMSALYDDISTVYLVQQHPNPGNAYRIRDALSAVRSHLTLLQYVLSIALIVHPCTPTHAITPFNRAHNCTPNEWTHDLRDRWPGG